MIRNEYSPFLSKLTPLSLGILSVFCNISFASIIADPNANINNKPIITKGVNNQNQNIPIIQIATPNHGISHNHYQEFSINSAGIILNNSRTGTNTQIAGKISANPFLQKGEAHTIINEVRGNRFSALSGDLEVAGQKANVIIANPNGINVQGLGFINVHEATLSTGKIINQQGKIDHQIKSGEIYFQNKNGYAIGGNNKNRPDYINLYAKALEINSNIFANHGIMVVAGENGSNDKNNNTIENKNSKNHIINVRDLGGMYADGIYLISNQKGLGVYQAGTLKANHNLIISSNGSLGNAGTLESTHGDIYLNGQNSVILSNGKINAQNGSIKINTKSASIHKTHIHSKQDIDIKSEENLGINGANIKSSEGDIHIFAKKSLSLFNTNSETPIGNINIISNQSIMTDNTNINANKDILLAALENVSFHKNSTFTSKENINSFSHKNQILENTNLKSNKNIQIQIQTGELKLDRANILSDGHSIIYSGGNQITNNSTISAKGIVSNIAKGDHDIIGTSRHTGTAVLLKTNKLTIDNEGQLIIQAKHNTDIKNNLVNNELNGNISIETNFPLSLNTNNYKIDAGKDINISSKSKLTLESKTNQKDNSIDIYQLNAHGGSVTLQGNDIELQASQINAKDNIHLYSPSGNIKLDGVQLKFSHQLQKTSLERQQLQEQLTLKNNQLTQFKNSQPWQNYQHKKQELNDRIANEEDYDWDADRLLPDTPYLKELRKNLDILIKNSSHLEKRYQELTDDINRLNRQISFLENHTSGYTHKNTALTTKTGDINLYAKKGIDISGATIKAGGSIHMEAQGTLSENYIPATKQNNQSKPVNGSIIADGLLSYHEIGHEGADDHHILSLFQKTTLQAGKHVNLRATQEANDTYLVLQGTKISAGGDISVATNHHLLLDVGVDNQYDYHKSVHKHGKIKRKTTITETVNEFSDANVSQLTGKNINLQVNGKPLHHLNIYGADLVAAGGNISLRSSGDIGLYAVKNQHNSQINSQTKKRFAGIRYDTTRANHSRRQITVLPAELNAKYIHTKSEGDTTLEGTRFHYLQGAKIEAGAKLNILPVSNILYEQQNKDSNYVVWQKIQNKGQITQTAQLPSFTGNSRPEFYAKGGIHVQIPVTEKDAQKRTLKENILELGKIPEYSYLNELAQNNQINWSEIILAQEQWNYTQQGLTGEGAAIVALAVAVATAGTGSGISAAVAGSAGSATVGAMAGSAFTALVSQASISLINNQGNVKAALKELGSKENVRGLAFAMATTGVSAKLDKTLAKYHIKTGQHSAFSDKVIKGIGEGVSRGVLENVVYGTNLEDALVKNLKGQLTNAATAAAFSDFVKHMDADAGDQNLVIKNISHKLAAALTGCISAAANSQSCESGAVGAAVGEMFGDFVVDKNTGVIDEKQREKLINQARLLAGITAAFSGNDVNTAADKAGEAVRWNSTAYDPAFIEGWSNMTMQEGARLTNGMNYCMSQGGSAQTCNPQIKNLRATDQSLLNQISRTYHAGDIQATQKLINDLDESLANWVAKSPNNVEVRAAAAATTYAIASFVIPTNAVELVPVGKAGKLKKTEATLKKTTKATAAQTATKSQTQVVNKTNTSTKTNCIAACFVAGTLIHTTDGLKPIENIKHGDLIWSRQEFGDTYDYRPVIATKITPNQEIYEVIVKYNNNTTEIFKTTSEHPFWVEGIGWLKASLLESGMILLDKHGLANVTIISQAKLDRTETVYNFGVQDFHTYHIGEYGVWVHNADCCGLLQKGGNKINGNTSKKLNEAWGTNYTSRDIGRGLESLKKENGIPANHHGKIMSNGDYVGENGINYGNILDYMS